MTTPRTARPGPAESADPSASAGSDPASPRPEGRTADAMEQAAQDVRRLCETVTDMVRLEWKRLRLRALDGVFGAGMALIGLGAASAVAIVGVVLFLWGVRGGLVRLFARFGADWLGDVVAGIVTVAGLLGALFWLRVRARRRTLGPPPSVKEKELR